MQDEKTQKTQKSVAKEAQSSTRKLKNIKLAAIFNVDTGFEFREIVDELDVLQGLVCGRIESVSNDSYLGYVNEEGVLKNLKPNFQAGGVLMMLGFRLDCAVIPGAIQGNLVLFGKNGRSLTSNEQQKIKNALDMYQAACES